ncbi:hypothetical protein LTR66_005896 [Elasticomyces elasticus]|nr:hypothetical protein LTR66_005896 [Elasticomyces elasticus]
MAGPVAIAKHSNAASNGVLPVPAAVLQAGAQGNRPATAKNTNTKLKLEVRRLPPGLSEAEFTKTLGDEWKKGGGKVDWMVYRPGKIKGVRPGKISEQSRAYLHLTSPDYIQLFEKAFSEFSFQDAAGSHQDQTLQHLPPSLDFAMNQKISATRQRLDGRQGTIDTDPDYQAFLEEQTQPVVKPAVPDGGVPEKQKEKITTTPLIEDLREKKANKAKVAATKPAKHISKDEKGDGKVAPTKNSRPSAAPATDSVKSKAALKVEQAARAAAEVLNREAGASSKATVKQSTVSTPATPSVERKRERGNPNAIKNLLQRDLGLAKRGGKQATSAPPIAPSADSKPQAATTTTAPAPTPSAPATQQNSANVPKGLRSPKVPRADRKAGPAGRDNSKTNTEMVKQPANVPAAPKILQKPAQTKPATLTQPTSTASSAAPSVTPSAPASATILTPQPIPQPPYRAFVKHANASAGITQPLLHTALSVFGTLINAEIDPKNGNAVAEFADYESLRKAVEKRWVEVAQGKVDVKEYRAKGAPKTQVVSSRGARGGSGGRSMGPRGGRGGRGSAAGRGGTNASPSPSAAAGSQGAPATSTGNVAIKSADGPATASSTVSKTPSVMATTFTQPTITPTTVGT